MAQRRYEEGRQNLPFQVTKSALTPAKTMEPPGKDNEEPELKFVRRKDDITGDDDDVMRVEMSCGHATVPASLTAWCRSLLDQGHLRFHCPADVNGEKCGKEWSYPEVRRNALLTETEQQDFEEKLAMFAAKYYHDFKELVLTALVLFMEPVGKQGKYLGEWRYSRKTSEYPQGYTCPLLRITAVVNVDSLTHAPEA
ncbi:hypothetical protein UY3_00998 [Chelonia mydas]|uniref:Uncharacterized protein n=1 Tax=Chelonia mydas TaxID=8469 RepID=M7CAP1_CHEMY|nr:hypothetical protein UY3_00998 [Chelonia mydas]